MCRDQSQGLFLALILDEETYLYEYGEQRMNQSMETGYFEQSPVSAHGETFL